MPVQKNDTVLRASLMSLTLCSDEPPTYRFEIFDGDVSVGTARVDGEGAARALCALFGADLGAEAARLAVPS